jgi:enoyl-CoA hydratase/carnithine racemase
MRRSSPLGFDRSCNWSAAGGAVPATPGYWTVTLNNPPINLFDPEMFAELRVLMDRIEEDQDVDAITAWPLRRTP